MHGKNFNQSEAKSAKRRVSRRRTTRHVTPGPLGGISLASFSRFISCVQLSPGLCVLFCPVCRGFPSGRLLSSWRPRCPRAPFSRPFDPATLPSLPSTPVRPLLHHANADTFPNPLSAVLASAECLRTSPCHRPLNLVCEPGVGVCLGRIFPRISDFCRAPSSGRFGETCPLSSSNPRSVYIWNGCGSSRLFRTSLGESLSLQDRRSMAANVRAANNIPESSPTANGSTRALHLD